MNPYHRPDGELQYFTAFIDEDYNQRDVVTWYQEIAGTPNSYHSTWGVTVDATLEDIIYYGYESALLIKEDGTVPPPIPEDERIIFFDRPRYVL